ncbi:Uncharacterized membrane protein YesL [Atopostipes suicloacalis DSM 15692]|uniref:Uncharacterized membrane protein YesL n=1 Tax=Atopostipes suicloacalis DSM 15692 TaxID=1121025 RepID=A0A1M4VLJ7_9LACT|nr:DUF624 domain-containing protein [Atopostipes suicloacalis]SHE69700.1 Uncharacterized membrane protein YesL [Atopostipes suicloacalis DSM 15692]
MKIINSKIYQIFTDLTNHVVLNILFLLSILPVITIGPAINSLFHVVSDWNTKNNKDVLVPYLRYFFRSVFSIDVIMSILLIFITGIYYINFTDLLPINAQNTLIIVLIMMVSLLLFIGIVVNYYLITVRETNKLKFINTLKKVVSYTTLNIGRTLIYGCLISLFLLLVDLFPPVIFIISTSVVKIILKIDTI